MNINQKINLRATRKHWHPAEPVAPVPYEPNAKPRKSGDYNRPFTQGRAAYRWVENCEAAGLRLVGFADEKSQWIKHRGWYTDSDGWGEVYRGIIYRLPARDGQNIYMVGYADPCNDGCALLSTELHYEKSPDDFGDVARAADHIAESFAEQEREYQTAWRAVSEAKDDSDEARETAREALEAMRQLEKCDGPTVRKVITRDWCEAWADYRKAMATLAEALDNDQGITLRNF